MAAANPPRSADNVQEYGAVERDGWFTTTPEPWEEIVALRYDGDRTYATTVYRMVTNAEPGQRPAMEAQLLATLAKPALTDAGRHFVCRMLGLIGSAACIAPLTPWLENDRSADDARLALDGMLEPGVDAAYRAALPKLTGAAKAGLIGSIGLRGDVKAVDALTAIAIDAREPAAVREIAERMVERLTVQGGAA